MRIPRVGDEWRLNWFKHKPIKTIGSFFPTWSHSRGRVVPGVMFKHQPKGKTIIVSVRFLLQNGTLVKPSKESS